MASSHDSTMPARPQSMGNGVATPALMGQRRYCCSAASGAKMANATNAATTARVTTKGDIPLIHIIVVVVSPTTLPAPPAFEAATMAARKLLPTRVSQTYFAITPPTVAAAMLSRNIDIAKTRARRTSPPVRLGGRRRGRASGIALSSNWLARPKMKNSMGFQTLSQPTFHEARFGRLIAGRTEASAVRCKSS